MSEKAFGLRIPVKVWLVAVTDSWPWKVDSMWASRDLAEKRHEKLDGWGAVEWVDIGYYEVSALRQLKQTVEQKTGA